MDSITAKSIRTSLFLSQIKNRDGILNQSPPPPLSTTQSNKISPAVLFIIVILAIIFFISGLLHLLVRLLIKKRPNSNRNQNNESSAPDSIQRQLQQLFHLHDSGLDQTIIDSLPVFLYEEIIGSKDPFDCAVCLSEFAKQDKLRLLPVCGHAFHINCIDTWLLSNSTCPLCRGSIFVPGFTVENPNFDFGDTIEEEEEEEEEEGEGERFQADSEYGKKIEEEKMVFPVRLGKFKNLSKRVNENGAVRTEEGETSSSNLDARRCYSMGTYQYILANANLQVSLSVRAKGMSVGSMRKEMSDGRKICASSRGESLSVSKIWQWSNNKGKFPINSSPLDSSSVSGGLSWMERNRSVV